MDISEKLRKMGLITGTELKKKQESDSSSETGKVLNIPTEQSDTKNSSLEASKVSSNNASKTTPLSNDSKLKDSKYNGYFHQKSDIESYEDYSFLEDEPVSLSTEERNNILEKILGGKQITNLDGSCWIVEQTFNSDYYHGCFRTDISLKVHSLLKLFPDFESITPENLLFLDIESSGLAGGSGTFGFLVCTGKMNDKGDFTIKQLLMRDMEDEPALLNYLSNELKDAEALVTFNGKVFDVPVLETRMRMNGIRSSMSSLPNLDLLFIARRISAGSMESHRLVACEDRFLDYRREDDIPGALVPLMYRRWLHNGYVDGLKKVFDHNAWDVLSLGLLGGLFGEMIADPDSIDSPGFMRGISRILANAGLRDESIELLSRAAFSSGNRDILTELARNLKKKKDYQGSMKIWKELAAPDPGGLIPMEEIAKHLEHREKDLEGALSITQEAISLVSSLPADFRDKWMFKLEKRSCRLQNRLEKKAERDRRKAERQLRKAERESKNSKSLSEQLNTKRKTPEV